MSSSPPRPKSSPTRTSANTTRKRTPLQEHTQSQTNLLSTRLAQPKEGGLSRNVYTTSPFPTKAQQVLLPSVIKKQKSSRNLVASARPTSPTLAASTQNVRGGARRPQVKLKRSVKTLRDMFEAQSDVSRPSTALSASSRPGTSSSRMRSVSSTDGLAGRFAWEQLGSIASDDLALLPSLPEGVSTLKRINSKSSFASRAARHAMTSSPNFNIIGDTSSPKMPIYRDLHQLGSPTFQEPISDSSIPEHDSSSPIVRRLGPISSAEELPYLEDTPTSNARNTVEASPSRTIVALPPSSPVRRSSSGSSTSSRKRKRSENDEGRSFADRIGSVNPFTSSSPYEESDASQSLTDIANLRSSPPAISEPPSSSIDDSSPVVRVLNNDTSSPARDHEVQTHVSLQAALAASPEPAVQYPLVRAPKEAQQAGLVIPKRNNNNRNSGEPTQQTKWPSRLSATPSETSLARSRAASKRSSWIDESEDDDVDVLALAQAYMMSGSINDSQVRIVSDAERHEGEDEVSALPGDEYAYRSPPLHPLRSNIYLGSPAGSLTHVNSIQSLIDVRLNSLRSRSGGSFRPSSSDSLAGTFVVPTWARRYYSGFYPDSFRFLAQSTTNVNVMTPNIKPQPSMPSERPESLATSRSSRPSLTSLRESLSNIPRMLRTRPRLEARRSHHLPGVGPLCSNPIRGPATAAMPGQLQAHWDPRATIRPVSFPLDAADPRAHWNGLTEDGEYVGEDGLPPPPQAHPRAYSSTTTSETPPHPAPQTNYAYQNRRSRVLSSSPHLHHDHRLNTGSTASRGFGHPFNRKSHYSAPSIYNETQGSPMTRSRKTQVTCFIAGFMIPLAWVVGAVLPLPRRPDSYHDLEKFHWQSASADVTDLEEMDVIARLRLEKQMKGVEEVEWQNIRWWRTLNRWMCIVGALVIILVIILAVLGTTTNF